MKATVLTQPALSIFTPLCVPCGADTSCQRRRGERLAATADDDKHKLITGMLASVDMKQSQCSRQAGETNGIPSWKADAGRPTCGVGGRRWSTALGWCIRYAPLRCRSQMIRPWWTPETGKRTNAHGGRDERTWSSLQSELQPPWLPLHAHWLRSGRNYNSHVSDMH